MKTAIANPYRVSQPAAWARLVLLGIALVACLTGCNKDKDDVTPVPPFAGKYEAVKSNNSKYTMTVTHKGGSRFTISNFAGFLNVPLEATASATELTIPTQTFTNPNGKQLILSGKGVLVGDELRIDYSVSGFTSYDGDVVAKRKP